MASEKEIKSALGVLATVFTDFELSDESIAVYVGVLSDVPSKALSGAVRKLLKEERVFFPKPGEIRARAATWNHEAKHAIEYIRRRREKLQRIVSCGESHKKEDLVSGVYTFHCKAGCGYYIPRERLILKVQKMSKAFPEPRKESRR